MTLPLLTLINETIESHLNRRAVIYHNGNKWYEESYGNLKEESIKVQNLLKTRCLDSKSKYILLHLNITNTYPPIVLGVLNSGFGFVCVDPDDVNAIRSYTKDFAVKYIISNIVFTKLHNDSGVCNATFEGSISLSTETIGLWTTYEEPKNHNTFKFLYAIKTSGTTGIPKTVQVPHDCIFPNLKDLSAILQINEADTILLLTPITFDPSVIELFLALISGATLCIIEKKSKQNPDLLLDLLFPQSGGLVSVIQTTPSLLRRWTPSVIRQRLFSEKSLLRHLILGGEEFSSIKELKSWDAPERIKIYNIYGTTEVSCWASINQIWPTNEIKTDIGNPLSETILQLISADDENEGELLIGSNTRKCLINDEVAETIFRSDKTIFRKTGDIFEKVDGKLIFKGRKDDQLKRWGIRISTSSIEEIARLNENIAFCICTTIQTGSHLRIGLFVIEKAITDLKEFKCFLRKYLPKASWPDAIISLNSFPLTSHGKVCKRSLKNMLLEEKKMLNQDVFNEMWKHYTSGKSLGSNDFFADGGDSLTALQLVAELKLISNSVPDILGLIMKNKTCVEVWNYLKDYKELKINEETNIVFNTANEIINRRNINVIKLALKGNIRVFDNGISSNINIIEQFKLKEVWKLNLGKCIDASPLGLTLTSGKDICIIGSHSGRVSVIEIVTGKLISECKLPDRVESSACISVDALIYYIGCYDGFLYAVFLKTGSIAWKFKTDDMVKTTCTTFGDAIIFGSYDKNMYCLKEGGILKWKTLLRSPILSESIIDGDFIYSATLGSVAALNAKTGVLLWEVEHAPVFSSPVYNKSMLIVADVLGQIQWLNCANGEKEYEFKINDMIFSSLVQCLIHNREILIFGCQDGSVYCLQDRKLLWKTAVDSRVVSTPFVELYEANSTGLIICCSTKGTVFILNFNNGDKISQYSLKGEVFSSPILMNGKVIVGCRDDNVYCLDIK